MPIAAESLRTSPDHFEISANDYANLAAKGAFVDRVDMVILSALEIDTRLQRQCHHRLGRRHARRVRRALRRRGRGQPRHRRGAADPQPHPDRRAPGHDGGDAGGVRSASLVTDHGIAVNPNRPEMAERLRAAGLPLTTIEEL